jgi:hypothetical protein
VDAFEVFVEVSLALRMLVIHLQRLQDLRVPQLILESFNPVVLSVALLVLNCELFDLFGDAILRRILLLSFIGVFRLATRIQIFKRINYPGRRVVKDFIFKVLLIEKLVSVVIIPDNRGKVLCVMLLC